MKTATKGSTLILVMISMIILSLICIAGLTSIGTEMSTARNYVADKTAFYAADAGINYGINEIRKTLFPPNVQLPIKEGDILFTNGGTSPSKPPVKAFKGFAAPLPLGMSVEMCSEMGATIVLWHLTVSTKGDPDSSNKNIANARKEISTIVAALAPEY